jgi:hypothetical protein
MAHWQREHCSECLGFGTAQQTEQACICSQRVFRAYINVHQR